MTRPSEKKFDTGSNDFYEDIPFHKHFDKLLSIVDDDWFIYILYLQILSSIYNFTGGNSSSNFLVVILFFIKSIQFLLFMYNMYKCTNYLHQGLINFQDFDGVLVRTKLVFIQTLIFFEGIESMLCEGGQILKWPASVLARRQIVQDCWQNLPTEADNSGDNEHEDDGPQAPSEDWSGAQTQSWPIIDCSEMKAW